MRLSLWLELAEDCNQSCQFCYNPWRALGTSGRPLLPPEKLRQGVAALLDRIPFEYVALSGGEPMLYPQLPSIIDTVAARSVPTVLTTNGMAVTRTRLARLRDHGLNAVQVPVLSHRPETHDVLSGGRSWRTAIRAIALALELGVDATMVTVLTRTNVHQLREIRELAQLLGVRRLIVNQFHAAGQGLDYAGQLALSTADFSLAFAAATGGTTGAGPSVQLVLGSGEHLDRVGPPGTDEVLPGAEPPPTPPGGTPHRAAPAVRRIAVSPNGDLKACNQSTGFFGSLYTDDLPGQVDWLARCLASGEHERLLATVRDCTCLGR